MSAPPPRHRHRRGRHDAPADPDQPCRLAVGFLQGLEARQIVQARQAAQAGGGVIQANRCREARRRAKAPERKACRAGTGPPESCRPKPARCDPAKFRIVLDVGHTAESEGASSARNVSEFTYNLRLAKRIEERLKAEGFTETKLLLTEGKARRSLFKRVAAASDLRADLLLSIHHDFVPNKFLEDWEFEGKKSRFSDRFSGYSVFVSRSNPEFRTSLAFAELIGKEMKAQGLDYAAAVFTTDHGPLPA